jgi:hypothetical protein
MFKKKLCHYVLLVTGYWQFPLWIAGWWFGTFFIFYKIWDVILPIDELIFFKMVIAPPTSI